MKTLFISVIFLFSATILNAQNFTFNDIYCPELPEDGILGCVQLFSSGEAIFTGKLADAYYDGNTVSVLPNVHKYGSDITAIEENSKIIAYSFRDDKYLYKWNDSSKTWYCTGLYTPMYNNHGGIYLLSSTIALCYSYTDDDSLFLWKFNIKDTTFTLLKKIASENDQAFGIINVFTRESDALIVVGRENKSIILSYDYDSTFTTVDVILLSVYRSYLFDNNFLYFIAGENQEKIIKWNSTTLEEEVIYTISYSNFYIYSFFVLSNNEIIFLENGYQENPSIKILTVNTGNITILKYGSFSCSYNQYLKKALFVSGDFITEMTISNGVITFQDKNPIKLYPNPATDKITIESNSTNNKIEIYNNLGQNVYSCYSTELTSEINVSEYPTGIYFVKLSDQNGKMITTKFIKN